MQQDIELFQGLRQSLTDEITSYGKIVRFEKGETLFDGDELLNYFYIVLDGKIKVFQMNLETGREQTIFILSRGDMFDTISLLDGKPHDVMNEGVVSGEALRLPIENVRRWIHDDPDFNRIFFPYLAKQMRSIETLATDLSLHSTSQRLIRLILDNIDTLDTEPLLNDFSHTEIANLIGSVRHVVDRHLKALKKDGIIDIARKKITIKDLHRLKEKIKGL